MSIPEQDWQAAVDAIGKAEVAVISCHVHPDGDALGSALALHRALAKAGRDAVVSFSEPFVVARHYRFLTGLDRLVPPDQVPRRSREPASKQTNRSASAGTWSGGTSRSSPVRKR